MSALGRMSVLMSLNSAEFTNGLTDAERKAAISSKAISDAITRGMVTAEIAITAIPRALEAAFGAVNRAFEGIDKLNDLKDITGTSIELLASLEYTAKATRNSFDDIANVLPKLSTNLAATDEDGRGAGRALAFLGINAKDANGNLKSAGQIMVETAIALNNYADGSGKAALMTDLAGKASVKLLPAMKDIGEQGLLLSSINTEQAQSVEDLLKASAKASAVMDQMVKQVSIASVPAFVSLKSATLDAASELLGLRDSSGQLLAGNELAQWANSAGGVLASMGDVVQLVARNIKSLGLELGASAAQAVALSRLDFSAYRAIDDALASDKKALFAGESVSDKYKRSVAVIGFDTVMAAQNRAATGGVDPRKALGYTRLDPKAMPEVKAQESAYDSLNKRIQEALALSSLELESIGKVSDAEKFATKILVDLANTKKVLDDDEKVRLTASLTAYLNVADAVEKKNREEKTAMDAAMAAAKIYDDEAAAILSVAEANRKAQVDALKGAQDTLQNLRLENTWILLNAEDRARANAMRVLEVSAIDKTTAAYGNLQVAMGIALAESKRLNEIKLFFEELDGAARNTFENILTNADKPFKALESFIRKQLMASLYDLTVKPWIISVQAQVAGASGGAGGLLDKLFGNLFGGSSSSKALDALGNGSWANGLSGLGFANGGQPPVGMASLVGERGPELFVPSSVGTIYPNAALQSLAGAGSNITVIDQSTRAAPVRYTEQTMPGGERALIIRDAVAAVNSNMHDPNSSTSRAMAQNYRGLARAR